MRYELTTPPEIEPVTLAEAKLHLKVEVTADDGLIGDDIQAAREELEETIGHALITQVWTGRLDCFPASGEITLARPPLQSVGSVKYVDENGTLQTLATTEYVVDTSGAKGRIYLAYDKSWPITRNEPGAVRVEFTAGFGDAASDVPARYRSWMLMRIGTLYVHRESVVVGSIATKVPGGAEVAMTERLGL